MWPRKVASSCLPLGGAAEDSPESAVRLADDSLLSTSATGVSHSRTIPSSLLLASSRPSALSATPWTGPVCPCNVASSRPVLASHNRTVLSALPLASSRPSALSATPQTPLVCPSSVANGRPVLASHSRTVPSALPAKHPPVSPQRQGMALPGIPLRG